MPDPSKPQSSVSPSAMRLAQRFGVSPEAMEEIISGTARESVPTMGPVSLPQEPVIHETEQSAVPVQEKPSTLVPPQEWMEERTFTESAPALSFTPAPSNEVIEVREEPVQPVITPVATPLVAPMLTEPTQPTPITTPTAAASGEPVSAYRTEPERIRPQASPRPERMTATVREETREKKGLSPLAVILGVLGILALVGIIWYFSHYSRGGREVLAPAPTLADSTTSADSTLAQDSTLINDSLENLASQPPAAAEPAVQPKAAQPKAKAKPARTRRPRRASSTSTPYVTTTSSLTAQEQLAELRAEGNRSAWLEAVEKNGVLVYKVHKTPRKKR